MGDKAVFLNEYLKHFDYRLASQAAGYSEDTGRSLRAAAKRTIEEECLKRYGKSHDDMRKLNQSTIPKDVDSLVDIGATPKQIAVIRMLPLDELLKEYPSLPERCRAIRSYRRLQLADAQHQTAIQGDAKMLMFLGQQYLGQTGKRMDQSKAPSSGNITMILGEPGRLTIHDNRDERLDIHSADVVPEAGAVRRLPGTVHGGGGEHQVRQDPGLHDLAAGAGPAEPGGLALEPLVGGSDLPAGPDGDEPND